LELGLELALGWIYRTVCYVEREAYAASCIVARMEEQELDQAPIWDDLKTFKGTPWCGVVDLISAGYPCQPFSVAGKGKQKNDPRHLWPDVKRIIEEVAPSFVFLENVDAHLKRGFREVASDLVELGYRVVGPDGKPTFGIYSAEEIGAGHRRCRLFCLAVKQAVGLADSHSTGCSLFGGGGLLDSIRKTCGHNTDGQSSSTVVNTKSQRWDQRRSEHEFWSRWNTTPSSSGVDQVDTHLSRLERWIEPKQERTNKQSPWPPGPEDDEAWKRVQASSQPAVCRGADGHPFAMDLRYRNDRLRCLGNGVVPATAALAFIDLAHRAGLIL
jgi:DNA (cytosine-5)-methyltransferase 1